MTSCTATTPSRAEPEPAAQQAARSSSAGTIPKTSTRHAPSSARRSVRTDDVLPGPRHGKRAIRELGKNISQVAKLNRISEPRLRQILTTDSTAWIGGQGRMFYKDEAPPAPPTTSQAPVYDPGLSTFELHSDSGADRVLYLDFKSTLVSGTYWNQAGYGGLAADTYAGFNAPYDDPGSFSEEEQAFIQDVWRRVSEDYAPFQIDVTTEDPGQAALVRNNPSDQKFGTKVFITSDPRPEPALCLNPCSGVAFTNVIDSTDPTGMLQPAWVFADVTGDSLYTANTVSHEAGHTFGLNHDGLGAPIPAEYYGGQANWAPIMGGGVEHAITQWSQGEYDHYYNAGDTLSGHEDDLAIIASNAPLKPDDYGDTTSASEDLGSQEAYDLDGLISTRADVDVFRISHACTDDLSVTATGIGEGSDLDISLSVLDATGTPVATDDPASGTTGSPPEPTGLDAQITNLPAPVGDYYVTAQGVGHADPVIDGYSDYASLGQYHLSITGCSGAPQLVADAPLEVQATNPAPGTGALTWSAPLNQGASEVTGYQVTSPTGAVTTVGPNPRSDMFTGLVPGDYTVSVAAINDVGTGPAVQMPLQIASWTPPTAPTLTASTATERVTLSWIPPDNPGGADLTGWHLVVTTPNHQVVYDTTLPKAQRSLTIVRSGGSYTATLTPVYGAEDSPSAATSFTIPAPRRASIPRIRAPLRGRRGGPKTAVVRWAAPLYNGGAAITRYQIRIQKLNKHRRIVRVHYTRWLWAGRRYAVLRLAKGRYTFRVRALNKAGASGWSRNSRIVRPR